MPNIFDTLYIEEDESKKFTLESSVPPPQVWERNDFYYICFAGFFKAFIAGFLNCVVIITYNIPVSHCTGVTSKMSISIVNFEIRDFLFTFFNLFSFFLGCVGVGFVITYEKFYYSRKYGVILIVESLLLLISVVLFLYDIDNIATFFASIAMGIHNSLFTNFSGAVVRTTHVTGLITDIGLIIGHLLRGKEENKDIWRLKVLVPLLFGFIAGGVIGTWCYVIFGQPCLYIPVILLFVTGSIWTIWRVVYKRLSDNHIEKFESHTK